MRQNPSFAIPTKPTHIHTPGKSSLSPQTSLVFVNILYPEVSQDSLSVRPCFGDILIWKTIYQIVDSGLVRCGSWGENEVKEELQAQSQSS